MEKKSKFYFAASIRGGRDDVELYRELINYMQTFGNVLTEHIGYESLEDSATSGPKSVAKIYFAASIRAGRIDAGIYHELIDYIKVHGRVMSESEQQDPEVDQGEINKHDKFIHDRDMAWLDESDAMIAEVTQPSLGVGYEIGRALERGKKILCLFRPDSGKVLSAMIRGAEDGKQMVVKDYQGDEAKKIIKDFLTANNLI